MTNAYCDLWDASDNHPLLTNPRFIHLIEDIYKCKSLHYVIENGNAQTGVPAFYVNSLLSGAKISSMPFNFYPLLLGNQDLETVIHSLIEKAQSVGTNCYMEYKSYERLSASFIEDHSLIEVESSFVSHLPVETNYEEQIKKYSKSLRQNLRTTTRKIVKEDIVMRNAENEDELKEWFHLLARLYRNKHKMISQPYSLFKKILFETQLPDSSDLLIAIHEKKIIGGIFILKDSTNWEYSWAATDDAYYKYGINTLLVDYAIKQVTNTETVKTFGFGSTPLSDEKLRYFKKRWGCTERPIYYYYWNHTPKTFDLDSSFTFLRNLYSKTPLSITKRIPEFIVPKLV